MKGIIKIRRRYKRVTFRKLSLCHVRENNPVYEGKPENQLICKFNDCGHSMPDDLDYKETTRTNIKSTSALKLRAC